MVFTELYHRIETHRRSTQPKKRNRCHAIIRHQNADAMILASALMRGIPPPHTPPPLDVRHCEYYQGGDASHKRTGQNHGVSILMTNYGHLRLRQNHRKNQEVGLLYSLYSVTVCCKSVTR